MCVVQRAGIGKNAIEVKKIYRAPDPDPRAGPGGIEGSADEVKGSPGLI